MGIFGLFLTYFGIFRYIFEYFGIFGYTEYIWSYLGTFGSIWAYLAIFGQSRLFGRLLVLFGWLVGRSAGRLLTCLVGRPVV